MRAYYFTTGKFALSNVQLRRIKISRFQDLNDPFELLAANLAEKRIRQKIKDLKDDINSKIGLICFSKNWKNPLVWGHYAEKHKGMALGFDIPDELLKSVIYSRKLNKITYDKLTGKPSKGVADRLIRTKFKDWKYEEEVRLFVDLDEERKESGLYFEPFTSNLKLREIILGPKCELSIKATRELVEDFTPKVEVIKARIAFTRFEVLESKKATQIDQKGLIG